jgi:hypothetical protein
MTTTIATQAASAHMPDPESAGAQYVTFICANENTGSMFYAFRKSEGGLLLRGCQKHRVMSWVC